MAIIHRLIIVVDGIVSFSQYWRAMKAISERLWMNEKRRWQKAGDSDSLNAVEQQHQRRPHEGREHEVVTICTARMKAHLNNFICHLTHCRPIRARHVRINQFHEAYVTVFERRQHLSRRYPIRRFQAAIRFCFIEIGIARETKLGPDVLWRQSVSETTTHRVNL